MKTIIRRTIPILVVTAFIASGIAAHRWLRQEPSDGPLVLYGNVDIRQVDLAFNDSERIDTMLVQEGDQVNQGQLLATLRKTRFKLAVAQSQARVEAQTQVVARLEAGSRPDEVRRAEAEVHAIQADVNDARTYYQRMDELIEADAGVRQERDDALARLNRAQAQLEAAGATLRLLQEGPRREDVAGARATLHAYEAELAMAQQHLTDADLTAPDDGIIQNRLLEPGDMAFPERPVLTLALTSPVWVRAYIDEPDLGRIHPGMAATIQTDSFPGKQYAGWVGFISPTAEFTPKSVQTPKLRTELVYQVRVFVKNPDNELRLGMPATITFDPGTRPDPNAPLR
jgi:HlyD family secretion protein